MRLRHLLVYLAIAIATACFPLLWFGMVWAAIMGMGVALLLVSSAAIMTPDLPNSDSE